MLRRDLYVGKVIWNSSRFVKVPGTNKRVRRAHPELQIVNDELWQRVQERQKCLMTIYSGAKKGLLPRLVTSPYLLSGILKCGVCGGNLIIITGYSSYGHYPQYGCSQHFNRGACSNSMLIRRDWIEERLLDELQNEVLKREAIDYVLDEFGSHLKDAFAKLSNQLGQMRERKQKLEGELTRLAETAAATGHRRFLLPRSMSGNSNCARLPTSFWPVGPIRLMPTSRKFGALSQSGWGTCALCWPETLPRRGKNS